MKVFELGYVGATPLAVEEVGRGEILKAMCKHATGDWGEVSEHDKLANVEGIANGLRIISLYTINGMRLMIITEADRSSTTALMASEY